MKIIFVTGQLQNGGAEREIAAFSSVFAGLNQEVHIFCLNDKAGDYEIDPRVRLHRLSLTSRVRIPKLRVLFRWRNATPELRNLHADIILAISLPAKYFPVVWLAASFSKTKLLHAVRNNPEKKYTAKEDRKAWRRAARFADGIWIQTEAQRRFFSTRIQKKLFEVPNILNPRFLKIPERERKEIRRFISVGRFHPQKNQKLLFEAFAKMLERTGDPYATLTIYGQAMPWDGPVEEELREMIRSCHLEDRVFLPGRVKEIEKCYEEADAFVFGSDYEGLPNALMEALATGLPCISTDCPTGPSALITNGENGMLVPVGDIETMSRAMQYFLQHPQDANRMGRAARCRMQSWESQEALAGRLLENFRRICG